MAFWIIIHFIFVYAKRSSPNVNLRMKRDTKLQKPVAHTRIRLGKRESDQKLKWMFIQKAKDLFIKEKYQISLSQWEVIVSKGSKRSIVMIVSGVKCKAPSYDYQVLWEVIYTYFYNWDGFHNLVLIVYALVELIIEASH